MNMKKSLIALAVAGAFVAPVAMAEEATVYGQMHLSVDHVRSGGSPSTKSNQLNSNRSRLGFKGAEDLGGGLSAIWQIESLIDADDGATGTMLGTRNTFLGLKSDSMGTILAGRHDTPYKIATRKLDVFANTVADNRDSNGMGAGHDVRLGNSLVYMSPDMGGVSIAASTVFGAENASGLKKGSALSLAAMFNMDQIYATVAYQNFKAGDAGTGDLGASGTILPGTASGDKDTAMKVGGGFNMDVFAINAVIERLTEKAVAGGDTKNTNMYVAGKFNVSPSDAVKVAYTKGGNSKSNTGTAIDGIKQMSVGYDHSMSANTTVYALFTKIKTNDTAIADPSIISAGMKHLF